MICGLRIAVICAMFATSACAGGNASAVYLQQIATSAQPGLVGGTVRHVTTAEPIAGVRVMLKLGKELMQTTTDAAGKFALEGSASATGTKHVMLAYRGSQITRELELPIDEGAELNFWIDPKVACGTVSYWKRAQVPATRPRSERVVGLVGPCAM